MLLCKHCTYCFREFDHPNIVKFYGIVKYYDEVALVMELCDKDLTKFYQGLKGVSDSKVGCFLMFKYFIDIFLQNF